MSPMGKLVLGLGAVAVAAGVLFTLRGPADGEAAPDAPLVRTEAVVEGPIQVLVAATGVVEPLFKVDVKSKASGEVVSFPAEPGDPIAAGAPIVELDPTDEARNVRLREAEVASNRASVAAAEADLGLAEARLVRAADLAKKNLVPPEEHENALFGRDKARASLDLAKSAVVRSEIALEEAKKRLADTKLSAPMTGLLLTKAVDRGHIIASGITSVSGGTSLATIADMSRVFVLADVDEADVGKVKPGSPARITADAFRDTVFRGKVDRVMPLGVAVNNVTVFKVKVEVVSENKSLLLPNMTADVKILVAEMDQAVLVPNSALRQRKGRAGVEVVAAADAKGEPEFREVKRGLTDGLVTAVEGVRPGELVVVTEDRPDSPQQRNPFRMFGIGRGGRRGSR